MGRMGRLGRMGRIGPLHNCPNGALQQHTSHQLLEEGEPKILIRLIRWILCPQNRSYYTKRQYWILCPQTKTYQILCPHPLGYRGSTDPLYPNKSSYTKTQYWILCPQTKILWPRGHYDLTASPTVKTSLRAGSNAGGWRLGDCLRTPAGRVANYLHNFAHLGLCRREKDSDEKACWLCSTSTFLHVALLLRSMDGEITVRVGGSGGS